MSKPKKRPDWISQEDYERTPATLTVREFHAEEKIIIETAVDRFEA